MSFLDKMKKNSRIILFIRRYHRLLGIFISHAEPQSFFPWERRQLACISTYWTSPVTYQLIALPGVMK